MNRTTTMTAGAAMLLSAVVLSGCAPQPTPATSEPAISTIAWESCAEWTDQFNKYSDMTGMEPISKEISSRLECGTLEVPLDYSEPDGRTIDLGLSRLLPEKASGRVVVTNPGGPGIEGRTLPAILAQSGMAKLAETSTIVGMDVRGIGSSTSFTCTDSLVDSTAVDSAELAKAVATSNEECVAQDREFFEHLTVQNAARDLDAVRAALGVSTIDYFGMSWGTELGVEYLSAFPDSVGRMLLDSVSDIRQVTSDTLHDVVAAQLTFASPADESTEPGEDASIEDDVVVEEEAPIDESAEPTEEENAELERMMTFLSALNNSAAKTALMCNVYQGAADPADQVRYLEERIETLGAGASERPQHPISASADVSICTGWPFEPVSIEPKAAPNAKLQIVGHAEEIVTPVSWAEHAHEVLGGELYILQDSVHASLRTSDKADAAVLFLTEGQPIG